VERIYHGRPGYPGHPRDRALRLTLGRLLLCPRSAPTRSAADVRREVLAREGGAGRGEILGCALEHDPTAVVAGPRDPDRCCNRVTDRASTSPISFPLRWCSSN